MWKWLLRKSMTPLHKSPDVIAAMQVCFGSALHGCGHPDFEGWDVTDYWGYKLYNSYDTPLGYQGLGGRAEATFCYFLEPTLEFSCISLYITIDISIFMCLESWSQDVEDSIVEQQCSLTTLFRDFQHFRKMYIDQEFSYWWYFISRDGPISNILSQLKVSAQLGKLLLASKGIESKANVRKDRDRSMMIFYQLPWLCVLTAESELLLANWQTKNYAKDLGVGSEILPERAISQLNMLSTQFSSLFWFSETVLISVTTCTTGALQVPSQH